MNKEVALTLVATTLAIGVLAWHAWETKKLRDAIEADTSSKKKIGDGQLELAREAIAKGLALTVDRVPNLEAVKEKPADA